MSAAQQDLFAPGMASEADSIILDLEAAVPAEQKDQARENVVEALTSGMTGWVRINGPNTDEWAEDLRQLQGLSGLRGVMLAMSEHPEQVSHTAMRLGAGVPVLALIESAVGVENAVEIARAPGTFRLALGTNDYRKDVGVSEDALAMAYARSRLVNASRVGKLPGAIDGPPAVEAAVETVVESSQLTASMGMTGRLCLNRSQVEDINKALSPSEDELAWAHEMLDAHEAGAQAGEGSYLPRLARAQKIADLADSYGLWNA